MPPRARDDEAGLCGRLGLGPTTRLLIVSCDDLGSSHAANLGVYDALRRGAATAAGLMVPCPWARGAAAEYRGEDVGVHLTLNAEWDLYRWGPITQSPSLLDGDGGFPRTVTDLWEHADLDEVRRELRAQVERAVYWGFDVSHLDSHLGAVQLRSEFFDVYLDLAEEFSLPVRLAGSERSVGFPFRALAAERGVLSPDHLVIGGGTDLGEIEGTLRQLPPGVTEATFRPALDTPELRALAPDWERRVADHDFLTSPGGLRAVAERTGVSLVGYRELRQLMRREVRLRTR